jgi:Na+/phosphate symporter
MLIAVILFSASMAIPALQGSQFKQLIMGAGIGLMLAAVISSISAIVDYFKTR